jgi:8-oxo-dGTP diphosphatase
MRKGFDYTGVAVVFLCHDGQGNYLFNKRSVNCRDEHGKWDCGGGSLEHSSEVEHNLKKEILEEYCTDVLNFEFLGFRDVHREHQGEKTHWVAFDYKVLVDREKVRNGEPHKFDNLGWFTLDGLPEPLHSQFPKFLELYENKL